MKKEMFKMNSYDIQCLPFYCAIQSTRNCSWSHGVVCESNLFPSLTLLNYE